MILTTSPITIHCVPLARKVLFYREKIIKKGRYLQEGQGKIKKGQDKLQIGTYSNQIYYVPDKS